MLSQRSSSTGGGVGGRRSGGNRAGALQDAESMAVIESPPTKEPPATKGKRKKVEIHNTQASRRHLLHALPHLNQFAIHHAYAPSEAWLPPRVPWLTPLNLLYRKS
jgi:hypothetical protein